MTPGCCEFNNKATCKHLVGIYCRARFEEIGYIRVTQEGLILLQKVGCSLFEEIK
jgi:hypothetical protein